MTRLLLERAWVDGHTHDRVLVEIRSGRFSRVEVGAAGPEAELVPGLTLPGFANGHSHAFHRALRAWVNRQGAPQPAEGAPQPADTFWAWREQMYALAQRLDPAGYYTLAHAVFGEMAAAGFTSVGEFHYVHHQTDGTPYPDPNILGAVVVAAARDAGLRITLLDTCYLAGGFGAPPAPEQRRFSDGSVEAWVERVSALGHTVSDQAGVVVGAAIHSVRAVPREALSVVARWAVEHEAPLHVHLSEQVAENEACLAAHGLTPTALLAAEGVLGPGTTVVHGTHLTPQDITMLADSGATACLCPTTEQDLGDGIGPARRLADAGVRLSLGSDSHAVIDPFAEMRALEMHQRLATQRRGLFTAGDLLQAATGHASLGVPDAGVIAVGQRADLVTLDTRSARTAGTGANENSAVFAASAADVRRVMVDGRVVFEGDHTGVGARLARAIEDVLGGAPT